MSSVATVSLADADQPAAKVFAIAIAEIHRSLQQLVEHEFTSTHGGSLALHEYRILLRRARTILRAGRTTLPQSTSVTLAAEMHRQLRSSAELRDLDVVHLHLDALGDSFSPVTREGLRGLCTLVAERCELLRSDFDGLLHSGSNVEMISAFKRLGLVYRVGGPDPGADAYRSASEVVRQAVQSEIRALGRAGHTVAERSRYADWHRVRSRLRHLLYLSDAFGPIVAMEAPQLPVAKICKLARLLGDLQDVVVTSEAVEAIGLAQGGRLALAAGAVIEPLGKDAHRLRRKARKRWLRLAADLPAV